MARDLQSFPLPEPGMAAHERFQAEVGSERR